MTVLQSPGVRFGIRDSSSNSISRLQREWLVASSKQVTRPSISFSIPNPKFDPSKFPQRKQSSTRKESFNDGNHKTEVTGRLGSPVRHELGKCTGAGSKLIRGNFQAMQH